MDAFTHIQAKLFSTSPLWTFLHTVSCQHLALQRSDGLLWAAFLSNYALKRPHHSGLLGILLSLTSSTEVVLNFDCTLEPPGVLLKYANAQALSQTYEIRISGGSSLIICISLMIPKQSYLCSHNFMQTLIYRICPHSGISLGHRKSLFFNYKRNEYLLFKGCIKSKEWSKVERKFRSSKPNSPIP